MGGKLGPKLCGIYALNAVVVVVGRKKNPRKQGWSKKVEGLVQIRAKEWFLGCVNPAS